MSRIRPVAGSTALHRRSLLTATGALALCAGAGYALLPGGDRAVAAGSADAAADEAVPASTRQAPAAPRVYGA
ncbi:TIGR03767 family metallophosphoesterase, partial [Streptomyces sp. NPDC007000]